MEKEKQHRHDISDGLLFKYFRNETTAVEEKEIEEWYNENEENRKKLGYIHDFYETYIMNAPIGLLEGYQSPGNTAGHRKKIRRIIYMAIVNIAVAVAIFFVSSHVAGEHARQEVSETFTSIKVPAGQRIDLTLCDGTTVKLNSGAYVRYPNMFSRHSREVYLEGEAYFDVEHDDGRPFTVRTFASDIEVLGTEFNVYADENADEFSTTLIEGSVKIISHLEPEKEIVLIPNQTARFTGNGISVKNIIPGSAVHWTKGILDIDTKDFAELVKKLEMAFGVKIVIDREVLPELQYVNGKLRISDGIISALDALQEVADFKYTKDYRTDTIYIR